MMPSFLTDAVNTQKFYYAPISTRIYTSKVKDITMTLSQIAETLKHLNIHPNEIADERLAEAFRIMLQLIEELYEENEKLKVENQNG
jgi:hypothetical protein